MWPGLVGWTKEAMLTAQPPLASAKDLAIPKCVANGDAAIEIIRAHHASCKKRSSNRRPTRRVDEPPK
jgi:hypothetical protein